MKFAKIIAVLAAPLLLAACLLAPGKFVSDMTVNRDGTFSFAYKGEVHMLGLAEMMKAANETEAAAAETFSPVCYDEQTFEDRECTEEEKTAQQAEWDAAATSRVSNRQQEAAMMRQLMGGIDPANPAAIQEFVDALKRQKGWRNVEYKGDGKFDVDFAITGTLDRDFTFPVVEKLASTAPFVIAIARADGSVRIEAPAFATSAGGGMGGMTSLMGLAAMGNTGSSSPDQMPALPLPEGTFTLRTDAEILANNTEEGPSSEGAMRVLTWAVSPRTTAAPTALLRTGN